VWSDCDGQRQNLGRDDQNLIVLWTQPAWLVDITWWPSYRQMLVPYNTTKDFNFTVTPLRPIVPARLLGYLNTMIHIRLTTRDLIHIIRAYPVSFL